MESERKISVLRGMRSAVDLEGKPSTLGSAPGATYAVPAAASAGVAFFMAKESARPG